MVPDTPEPGYGLNWSGNLAYGAARVARPRSVDELAEVVAGSARVRALGSRHSFSDVADTDGTHVVLDAMPRDLVVDHDAMTVTAPAGATCAEVAERLAAEGVALPNTASLPHISLAGAVQTGTHGSGLANPPLAAHVTALDLVDGRGEARRVESADELDAVVVGLGAAGVVHAVTQRVVPAFEVAQRCFTGLPFDALTEGFDEVMGCGYSVSLFTRYRRRTVEQVWVKSLVDAPAGHDHDVPERLGATPARVPLHPLPGGDAEATTEQLGVPGPSHERLPHFRAGFRPSKGEELQSELFVDRHLAVEALGRLRGLAAVLAPVLLVAEVRCVAADAAWLSPTQGHDSVALHFTWRREPDAVRAVMVEVEAALRDLGPRPHWGKVTGGTLDLALAYPRLGAFLDRLDGPAGLDPEGRFANAFLGRLREATGR